MKLTEEILDRLLKDHYKVTVCDNCKRSACLQGSFYCDEYQSAGITQMSVKDLRELDLEHPEFWLIDLIEQGIIDKKYHPLDQIGLIWGAI